MSVTPVGHRRDRGDVRRQAAHRDVRRRARHSTGAAHAGAAGTGQSDTGPVRVGGDGLRGNTKRRNAHRNAHRGGTRGDRSVGRSSASSHTRRSDHGSCHAPACDTRGRGRPCRRRTGRARHPAPDASASTDPGRAAGRRRGVGGHPIGTPTGTPAEGRRPINPFLRADPAQRARRLARALVSDLVAYHPQKREEGLRDGTLRQLFREEIKKSYEEYVEQVGREAAEGAPYFQEALNDILAGGRRLF